nr:ABC transporter permease [Propionibacterium sp.]
MAETRRRGGLHNLGTVVSFEVRRTLKRRSFWIMTLSVPLLLVLLVTLITFSNSRAFESDSDVGRVPVTFTYADASGLVDPAVAAAFGGTPAADAAAARAAVVAGRADLFVAYPDDPTREPIEVVGRDVGLLGGPNYVGVALRTLEESVRAQVGDPRVAGILTGAGEVDLVTYRDGAVAPGWASVVLPGLFIVLFYLAIVMLGNQMLQITVEEKENRVTEMILTTIHPTTLIVGKVAALLVVGVVQALVLTGPALLLPSLLPAGALQGAGLPDDVLPTGADLAAAIDPVRIAVGAALFVGAFLLFTGLLVSIGAVMPTAKEAGSAFGAVIIVLFLPFYAFGLILTEPRGLASQVLTFFPLTAPITAMLRNAAGSLAPWEAGVALAIIYGGAALFLALGVRLFRTGSISYDQRLDLRKVLGRRGARA